MSLLERIDRDLVTARKGRDDVALATLGLLKSEVVQAGKKSEPGGRADDGSVLRVVRRELKRREEAAEAYEAAGRTESAARERAEADVLRSYLPAQLGDDELDQELRAVIQEVKPQGPRDFGAVMRAANARLAGRAEGGRVATAARRLLGG